MSAIERLVELNKQHSMEFTSPSMTLERRRYRAQHPTEIGAFKCMDGRLHLPVITKTALGIIQPWRNIAGRFDLGWIAFQQSVKEWVDYSVRRGRDCLALITYHYSRSSEHRGCAGFKYDTAAARSFAAALTEDFREVFGDTVVRAIQIGVETDLDALILHGENGEVINLSTLTDHSDETIDRMLRNIYPSMSERMLLDFAPLVKGNIRHIGEIRASQRPLSDAEHCESIIAVGRGLDWLHEANTAIIVGPFDPDLKGAIVTAGKIIASNIREGRIDASSEVVLMASAPYRDQAGPERRLAKKKALFLKDFSLNAIREGVPEIVPHLHYLAVTVNMHTRLMHIMDRS